MPNFLCLDELNILPPNKKKKGGGGTPAMTDSQIEQQMKKQEEMMMRQIEVQQRFQRDTEERLRLEREKERQIEYLRRQEAAASKETSRTQEEKQEAALFREMTGQTDQEDTSDFGGGFNLDMPTIERPDYEQQDRPI